MAIYPHDAIDADSLLQFADLAMYEAKAGGHGLCLANRGERRALEQSLAFDRAGDDKASEAVG